MKFEWTPRKAVLKTGQPIDPNGHEMWCADHLGFFVTRVEGTWWVFHRHADWPVDEYVTREARSFEHAKRLAEDSALKHLQ